MKECLVTLRVDPHFKRALYEFPTHTHYIE